MSEADFDLLLQGLWRGTAALNTPSKLGHDPLLLAVAQYQPGYRLGALPRRLDLADQTADDTALRSTRDYRLEVGDLLAAWRDFPALTGLRVAQDNRLQCRAGTETGLFAELAGQAGLPVAALDL